MEGQVQLSLQPITYRFELSRRSRSLRLMMREEGVVLVRGRKFPGHGEMDRLMRKHEAWILKTHRKLEACTRIQIPESFSVVKAKTQVMIRERISFWNGILRCEVRGIMIRRGQSRWGSCSRTGMLSFNYRLALLTPDLVDYVVIHELCHLREFNHSPRFWSHVERYIPDWKERRRALRQIRFSEGLSKS